MDWVLEGALVGAGIVFMIRVINLMNEGLALKKLQLKKEGKL